MRDRRATEQRYELVRTILAEVFAHPWFTVAECRNRLGIATDVCERILGELERGGAIRQNPPGHWTRRLGASWLG